MKKSIECKRTIMFLMMLVIMAALSGIFWMMWSIFFKDTIVLPFYRKGNWLLIVVYAILLFVFTSIYGGYRIGYYRVADVIYSQTLSLVFINVITYFQISLISRQFVSVAPIAGMSVVQVGVIIVWSVATNRVYYKLYPPRRLMLVYGSHSAESLVYKMCTRGDKYQICFAIDVVEGYDAIIRHFQEYDAVIICDVPAEVRNRLLKYCFAHSIRTYLTPKISDIILSGADSIHLFDTPLLLCKNGGISFEQRLMKRALDILVSAVGLLLFSPFMLVTAAAIKLYDGGPVLFKQTRLTRGGRSFAIYKFRSMVVDAESDGVPRLASKNDSRITPVGRVIRQIRFDELPQLLNILRGEMSVVGPRPERPEIFEQYTEIMPEFSFRLKVKAGLTGYAQVLGKYNTTPYDKLKLDLMYIERYTLFMDLKLILMTIKILFFPESTEGVAQGTATPADRPDKDQ